MFRMKHHGTLFIFQRNDTVPPFFYSLEYISTLVLFSFFQWNITALFLFFFALMFFLVFFFPCIRFFLFVVIGIPQYFCSFFFSFFPLKCYSTFCRISAAKIVPVPMGFVRITTSPEAHTYHIVRGLVPETRADNSDPMQLRRDATTIVTAGPITFSRSYIR